MSTWPSISCTARSGATLQQVRGERVAKRMGRRLLRDTHPLDAFSKHVPRAHARERLARRVQEDHAFPVLFSSLGRESCRYVASAPMIERPTAPGAPLPEEPHQLVVHQRIALAQSDPLGDAQADSVGLLEHGFEFVSHSSRRASVDISFARAIARSPASGIAGTGISTRRSQAWTMHGCR